MIEQVDTALHLHGLEKFYEVNALLHGLSGTISYENPRPDLDPAKGCPE